jgi:hypothetical protein
MRRIGIWCPRHPIEKLVRTDLPNGKIDLRCPACTMARIASIKVALAAEDAA